MTEDGALPPNASCRLCRADWEEGASFCTACGAPGEEMLFYSRWRTAAGLSALGLSLAAAAFLLASDILRGRHALSTKDSRFQQEVRCRESGGPCPRLP